MTEETSLTERTYQTAFVVFLDETGQWGATTDLDADFSILRPANDADMALGGTALAAHINNTRTAQHAAQMAAQLVLENLPGAMQNFGRQMAEQAQNQQIAQATGLSNGGLDLSMLKKR